MTNELKKTAAFAATALVLLLAAWFVNRPRVTTADAFSEQGQPFDASFKDPQQATSLEVFSYDPSTAAGDAFSVALKDKKGWVIPSHNDYPADAKDRLARTASGIIDLKKDVIAADGPEAHAAMEVIDPTDTKSTALQGRGKRVTLKDASGQTLADLIIGKTVPDNPRQRYVRVPGKDRTYAVNLPEGFDLSTRFGDWIETNLLKLDPFKLTKITIDNHKVDPEAGTVDRGEVLVLDRKTPSAPWNMESLPAGRVLDTAKVSAMTSALADLKIVGVRPMPEGLTAGLKADTTEGGGLTITPEIRRSLQTRGYYLLKDGQLLSNQGDVILSGDDGVVYVLRFGEVTFASGETLTAGKGEDGPKPKPDDATKKDGAATPQGSIESRYLFVTAQFDPSLIDKPEPAPPAVPASGELPADAFQRTPQEIQAAEAAASQRLEAYNQKVEAGKKRAQELTDRFAHWYYVVPGDAFRSIVLDRTALTRSINDPGEPPAGPGGGLPPGFPGGMLPPGLMGGPGGSGR
jgi:hypothetical protein